MSRRVLAATVLVGTGILVAPRVFGQASFQGLGGMSTVNAISADGLVVVGYDWLTEIKEAARWTASDGIVGLGQLPGADIHGSGANAASANGATIAGIGRSGGPTAPRWEAFVWAQDSGMTGLGDLPGGGFFSEALDVSADGRIVVGGSDSDPTGGSSTHRQAFRWTEAQGMSGLGDLAGGMFYSSATAISADGSTVVGRSYSAFGQEAFMWTQNNGMVGLGDLPGGEFRSFAQDVSVDGSVVVGNGHSGPLWQAFRWTETEGMIELGSLSGGDGFSWATAVSGDGSVVVGYGNSWRGQEPFIWDAAHGMRSLRDVLMYDLGVYLAGFDLWEANDISADGLMIVGKGRGPPDEVQGWIAYLPDPATLYLLAVGSFLVIKRRCQEH